mgnify:CR=1 FL=1
MPKYAELKASLVALWQVMTYLRAELADVKYCSTPNLQPGVAMATDGPLPSYNGVKTESKWFEGQRMVLEDAIAHVDKMITDVEVQIEAL